MSIDVVDLRKGDRFVVLEPVGGAFGTNEIVLINLSLTGAQFSHQQPVRIGTRGRLTFGHGDVFAAMSAHVVWSRLAKTERGMVYTTGVKFDELDPQFAAALNALYKAGVVQRDVDSLERKRQRMIEREAQRKSQVRVIPTSEPPPT
ncbi:MAG TPA: PilZ domain-containing protein [Thermoanaerobaculia bacterium]|nr:PilZ domain-containing protein [Thermoanaerobaculia bacterium]